VANLENRNFWSGWVGAATLSDSNFKQPTDVIARLDRAIQMPWGCEGADPRSP
jgi:hypothetical protein